MNFCFNCGSRVENDWITCPKCSATLKLNVYKEQDTQVLKKICLNCGVEIQEGWKICPHCNNRIKFTSGKKPIIPGLSNTTAAIVLSIFVILVVFIISII